LSFRRKRLCRNSKATSFRTNPRLGDAIRNPEEFYINGPLLDPGSRPALRNLAGMTNYDTALEAGIQSVQAVTVAPDPDPGFTGVTTFYEAVNIMEEICRIY
jgi:hypothetical protein